MRGPVKVLNPENLEGLETGQQLFITTWVAKSVLLSDAPCMVVGRNGDDFLAIYITAEGDGAQVRLPVSEYGKTWNASISDGFAIRTPGGPLIATPYIDPNTRGSRFGELTPRAARLFSGLPWSSTPLAAKDSAALTLTGRIWQNRRLPRFPWSESPSVMGSLSRVRIASILTMPASMRSPLDL